MAATELPEWLITHLTELGRWNADGIARRAQVRRHGCGALVVCGLDARACALPAVVQLGALDALGEAVAVLTQRRTYDLWGWDAGRLELERRYDWDIAGHPPGARTDVPVVGEHVCGAPLPAHAMPRAYVPTTTSTPPF